LKDCLTEYGLDVFLAHEDIAQSAAWVQTILAELKAADVFLPLLTDNFPGSKFTDQETGLAVAGDKLTIPLKVHIDVLDRVLDKGIVIDAWVRLSLVGIDLVTVEARVVVASIATYLQYSEPLGVSSVFTSSAGPALSEKRH
jgi:gas vesicle structural protein